MSGRRGAVLLTGNEKNEACKKNCYDEYPNATAYDQPAILECIRTNCRIGIAGGRKRKSRRNSRKNKRSKRQSRKIAKSNKKR